MAIATRRAARRLVRLVRPHRVERELDDELRFHLEAAAAEYRVQGLSAGAAWQRARDDFGDVEGVRAAARAARGGAWIDDLQRDLRYATRALRRDGVSTLAAVATLALGVGAAALGFALVHAELLRPLPFPRPHELVQLSVAVGGAAEGGAQPARWRWSYPQVAWLEDAATRPGRGDAAPTFAAVAGSFATEVNVAPGAVVGTPTADAVERVTAELVTAGYLAVIGHAPVRGRPFRADEHDARHPGAAPVAMVGAPLARRWFGNEAAAPGRTLRVNGVPLTVVGVLPDGATGVSGRAALWIPAATGVRVAVADLLTSDEAFIAVTARLAPSPRAPERARAALAVLGAQLADAAPDAESAAEAETRGVPLGIDLQPLREAATDPARRRAVLVLFAAVLGVLAVAALNLLVLELGRAATRAREFALRASLGATRGRLLRQALADGAALGVVGGLLGLGAAAAALRGVAALAPAGGSAEGSGWAQIAGAFAGGVAGEGARIATPAVVAFTVGTALLVMLLVTLAGALAAPWSRGRRAGRGPGGAPGLWGARSAAAAAPPRRALTALAAAQLAAACALVACAGLLLRSYSTLAARPLGFDPHGVLTFWVTPADPTYSTRAGAERAARLLERLARTPGVAAASVARCTPYMPTCSSVPATALGVGAGARTLVVGRHDVGPDHFRLLRIPLVAGRGFTAADRSGAPKVVVVGATAARRLWPGVAPAAVLGRRLVLGDAAWAGVLDSTAVVVGVAADVTYWPVDAEPDADVYAPAMQRALATTMVLVRPTPGTRVDAPALAAALRDAVRSEDPELPLVDVAPLEARLARALGARRTLLGTLAGLAATALLLAGVGVYGVIAYSVERRRAEFGVRLALGAGRRGVLALVLRQGVLLAAAGGVGGALVSFASARALRAMLYGVSPADPLAVAGTALTLVAVALAAAARPAWRASRTDVAGLLRAE
jgi:predicted permease